MAALPVLAQFQDLATDYAGSVLYFSSSARQKGSGQNDNPKIFIIDGAGIRLVEERGAGPRVGYTVASFYRLTAPQVSSDGRVLAYTASRECSGGSGCLPVEQHQANIITGGGRQAYSGKVRLSRDGRWALVFGSTVLGSVNPGTQLINVATGEKTKLPTAPGVVASSGAVVLNQQGRLSLWRGGSARTLKNTAPASEVLIDDAATRAVYGSGEKLIAIDTASGVESVLSTAAGPFAVAADGRAAYASGNRIFVEGGPAPVLPENVTALAISGDGYSVFAATENGRILRAGSEVLELIPRTPGVASIDPAVPGSLIRVRGSALQGSGVKLGGVPLPLAWSTPGELAFEVPSYFEERDTPFSLTGDDSPFETAPATVLVEKVHPWFWDVFVHQEWDALVSAAQPARPGEIMHVYMGGLGQANLFSPLVCTMWRADARVLYAGPAPEFSGVYQVSLRVPEGTQSGLAPLACSAGSSNSAFAYVPIE